ncbi:MAG TPA: endonuclease, partial [Tenuifilaceae bacterium]|nr:endonuclease [Tenuifilaceae bacterium]
MRLFYTLNWKGIGGEITRRVHLMLLFVLLSSITLFAQAPAGYYDGANGKTGAELKTALYNIIKCNYENPSEDHTELSYSALWTAFQYTDKRSDGKVWDMYSSCNFTFVTDQDNGSGGANECEKYNREHSFPKSWFNDGYPMYTDLFHLYPTDKKVNNVRGNDPFGEVTSPTYTSSNGSKWGDCSYPGYTGTVFEPIDEYKGDFARSYFYMVTRYEDVIQSWSTPMLDGTKFPAFSSWSKTMLIEWHNQDPVSQKEIDRNNVIFNDYQHNRNPFIDNPNYVDLVWGNGYVSVSFTSTPSTTAQAGTTYTYNITVTGNPGATFTITATTKPSLLELNSTGNGTATLTWTPTEDNVGDNRVVLNVTDGTSSKEQEFIIKVASSIVPLQFTSAPVTSAQVGVVYTYNVALTGNSGSTFTITPTSIPSWLKLNSTGNGTATLTGTPTSGDVGANAVVLTGGYGATTVEQTFSINVTEAGTGTSFVETFENMQDSPINSYIASFNWTGDNSINWSATYARIDQTINNQAICFKDQTNPLPYLQSQTLTGGCSQIKFKHQQKFSGSGGVITVFVNNNQIGTVDVTVDVQTATFTVNVSGDFVVKLASNGVARIAIDDLEWQTNSSSPNQAPTITGESRNPANPTSADNVGVSATVTDPEGRLSSVQLQWGTASNALSNTLSMTNSSSTYSATIPAQTTGTIVYYRIKATDQEGNFSESTIQNYTVSPSTDIDDNQQNKVTVYPNPFGETLNIKVDGLGSTKVTVMDIIGKVVLTAEFFDKIYPINTSNLKAGIYFVKVLNGDKTNVIRVVKR